MLKKEKSMISVSEFRGVLDVNELRILKNSDVLFYFVSVFTHHFRSNYLHRGSHEKSLRIIESSTTKIIVCLLTCLC